MSRARENGILLNIIKEALSQPENHDDPVWRATNAAVLSLCSHWGSYSANTSKSTNFQNVVTTVSGFMERITKELELIESLMRTSGELAMLGALPFDNAMYDKESKRARQNDDNILGKHPMYLKYEKSFKKEPVLMFASAASPGFPYYTNIPRAMFDEFPEDMREMCVWMADACGVAVPPSTPMECTINAQPYIFFLLMIARRVNGGFHEKIKSLVGGSRYGDGNPLEANIKGYSRMKEKQEEKYTHQEYGMPGSSVMCDVVRCLVTCADPDDMRKVRRCFLFFFSSFFFLLFFSSRRTCA